MLVDPATGIPIEEGGTEAQSTFGAAGQAAIGDPNSLAYELLGHVPGAATVTAWNMGRGMNTLTDGGYTRGRRLGNFGKRPATISRLANTFSPLRFGSFSDPLNITGGPTGATYTPFNFLGTMGNRATQAMAKRAMASTELAQEAISKTDQSAAKVLARLGVSEKQMASVAAGETTVFDGGVLARIGASQRLGYMAPGRRGRLSRRDARRVAKSIYSLNRIGADVSRIPGSQQVLAGAGRRFGTRSGASILRKMPDGGLGAARGASIGMLGSMKSVTGQRMGGYLAGMMDTGGDAFRHFPGASTTFRKSFANSRSGMKVAAELLDKPVDKVLQAGATRSLGYAARAAMTKGGGGVAAQLALKGTVLGGSKLIPIVGQIALIHDVASMGLAVLKRGADVAQDANKSFQGQIQKPIFGMGYKDNAVNATSRSRGLTAIQSSRLNARNALGHEAGMLASHFG